MNLKKCVGPGLAGLLLMSTLAVAGCAANEPAAETPAEEPAAALEGTINVQGSDTMLNIGVAWAEEFMNENPGVEVSVQGGGTGTGIAALINGTVDFANASRDLDEEEVQEASAAGVEAVAHRVAIDGIAVVVNPANGVGELTMEQLGQIYRGEITNWQEVGGIDQEIVLLSRDSASGTFEFFRDEVLGEEAEFAPQAKLLKATQGIVDETIANEAAIGYIGLGYLTEDVKVVAIDGVKASVESAADGTYPIGRFLYMISSGAPTGIMQAYLEWILGPAGQQLVRDEGFVPLPQ